MRRNFLFIVGLFLTSQMFAQTGIGTTTPHASAKLDVTSTNKGFLPPRVSIDSAKDVTSIVNPAEGLLVYNTGTVGLQAGYYYWNGGSWATIATASSAGNGVTSSDLVKLYQEGYSTTSGSASSTDGYSFTVPVSGRYEFNFNSTGWNATSGSTVKLTFNVRQGTTVLGSDYHQSASSNVWAEYEGRVEVNLTAGVTYNAQVVTSIGNRNAKDFDKIFYKMVAGNLPVTGQTVDYGIARYTGADGGGLAAGALVSFDATAAGNLSWSANKFTLKANKTYEIESSLAIYNTSSGSAGRFQIYDYTNAISLANSLFMSQNGTGSNSQNANTPMKCIVTPASDIQVGIRLLDFYGGAPGIVGNAVLSGSTSASNASYFVVKQIGSSAIINPWTLAGTNIYNTTGNVGIGTSSPTTTLDVTGSLQVSGNTTLKSNAIIGTGVGSEGGEIQLVNAATGSSLSGTAVSADIYQDRLRIFEGGGNFRGVFLDLAKAPSGVGGELMYKASGFVNRGVDVTLGNLKARIAATGNFSVQLSTVSGSYSVYGSHFLVDNGSYSNGIDGSSPRSITTTPTYINSGNNFLGAGNTSVWLLMDTTAQISWRITMIVGAGYNNNFISIERL
jgi:hypothetical protein